MEKSRTLPAIFHTPTFLPPLPNQPLEILTLADLIYHENTKDTKKSIFQKKFFVSFISGNKRTPHRHPAGKAARLSTPFPHTPHHLPHNIKFHSPYPTAPPLSTRYGNHHGTMQRSSAYPHNTRITASGSRSTYFPVRPYDPSAPLIPYPPLHTKNCPPPPLYATHSPP